MAGFIGAEIAGATSTLELSRVFNFWIASAFVVWVLCLLIAWRRILIRMRTALRIWATEGNRMSSADLTKRDICQFGYQIPDQLRGRLPMRNYILLAFISLITVS